MITKECPMCNGEGSIMRPRFDDWDDIHFVKCPTCEGKGEVETPAKKYFKNLDEYLVWLKKEIHSKSYPVTATEDGIPMSDFVHWTRLALEGYRGGWD